jgi:hypothetical protein
MTSKGVQTFYDRECDLTWAGGTIELPSNRTRHKTTIKPSGAPITRHGAVRRYRVVRGKVVFIPSLEDNQ